MIPLFIYIIKSTFCLLLFYLGYKVLLSRETFLDFNRMVLLTGMCICLLLPLIEIKISSPGVIQESFLQLEKMIVFTSEDFITETVEIALSEEAEDQSIPVVSSDTFSFLLFCQSVYWIGMGIVFLVILNSLLSVCYLVRNGQKIRMQGYVLVLLNRTITPFNWWKYIILSYKDYEMYQEEILTHELAHYHKRHGWDLFFAECVILIHWFNPAAWLLKRELQEIHEYQADKSVLESGIDATKYQLLLVKKAVGSSSYTFANSFNQSKLKKRITMMCKKQSNQWARWKLLLLIPLAGFTVYAFARPDVNRQLSQLLPDEDTVFQSDIKQDLPESFRTESKAYFEQRGGMPDLNEREKIDWVLEHTNTAFLLINSRGDILYQNERVTLEELPAKLEVTWLKEYSDSRPVMICIQDDLATPEEKRQELFKTVKTTFDELKKRVDLQGKELLVYYFHARNYGKQVSLEESPDIDLSSISISFYIQNSPMGKLNLVMHESLDNMSKVMEKFKPEDVVRVEIKAPADTKMYVITAIKQKIREVLYPNHLYVKYSLSS